MKTIANPMSAQQSYTDIHQLQKINELGRENKQAAFGEMAKQFESLFIDSMLKQMRQASSVMSEGGMFDSNDMKLYQQMFDQQLALSLSQGGGMGLASMIEKQLMQQYMAEQQDSNAKIEVGPLPPRTAIKALAQEFQQASVSAQQLQQQNPQLPQSKPATPAEFVANITPYAKQAGEKLGVDYKLIIAQAALESGWGKSSNGNNLFGIKAGENWSGLSQQKNTQEFVGGEMQTELARFRGYQNYGQSMADYSDFISTSARYQNALEQSSPKQYIEGLQRAGYATDPNYSKKVMRIYGGQTLEQALQQYHQAAQAGSK